MDIIESDDRLQDLVIDQNDNHWFTTRKIGLVKWDGLDEFETYDVTNSNILSNSARTLRIARDSILWIVHSWGLSKMKIDQAISNTKNLDTSAAHFSLYPNPTPSSFTLSFPHIEKRKIEVFNVSGQRVYSIEKSEEDLEINLTSQSLISNVYYVKASGASGIAVEKVVVY